MANGYDKNKPKHQWGSGWMKNAVTEKQAGYLEKLAVQKNVTLKNTETMTRGDASSLIEELNRYSPNHPRTVRYLISDFSEYVEFGQ